MPINIHIEADNPTEARNLMIGLLYGSVAAPETAPTPHTPTQGPQEAPPANKDAPPASGSPATAQPEAAPRRTRGKAKTEEGTETVKKADLPAAESTAPELYVYDGAGDIVNTFNNEADYVAGVREVLGQQTTVADLDEAWRVNAAVLNIADKDRLKLLEAHLADLRNTLSKLEDPEAEDALLADASAASTDELPAANNDNVRHALVLWIKQVRGTSNHGKPAELLTKLGAVDKCDMGQDGKPKPKASLLDSKHYPAFEKAAAEAMGKTVAELRATPE